MTHTAALAIRCSLLLAALTCSGCCREFTFPTNHEELEATRHAQHYFLMSYPVTLSWHSLGYSPTGPRLSHFEIQILLQLELAGLLSEDAVAAAFSTAEVRQWNLVAEGDDPVAWVRDRIAVFNPSDGQVWVLALVDQRAPSAAMQAILDSLAAQHTARARLEEEARRAFLEAKQWRGERGKLSEPVAAAYAAWDARVESAAADLRRGESLVALSEFSRELIDSSTFGALSHEEVIDGIHHKVTYWAERGRPIIEFIPIGPAEFSEGR